MPPNLCFRSWATMLQLQQSQSIRVRRGAQHCVAVQADAFEKVGAELESGEIGGCWEDPRELRIHT